MKMDQLAYVCNTQQAADYVKGIFGLTNSVWVKDTVTAQSSVFGRPFVKNIAQLQFCYDLDIELEILRYTSGPNFHERSLLKEPYVSHVGIHLGDDEDFPDIAGLGKGTCQLVQETKTISHTSEYLTTGAGAGRLYHYKIFQIQTGNYLKFIKRIRDNEKAFQAAVEDAA